MADGGTPLEQQIAEAEALAEQLPELTRTASNLVDRVAAAELAVTHERATWSRAHDDATAARLPHLRAWGALVTLRYRSTRDAARAVEDDTAAVLAQAEQELAERKREQENLRARTSRVLVATNGLPALRQARRLEELRAQGDPLAAQVDAVDADLARADDRLRELAEADTALGRALEAVRDATRKLGSAKSWGTYDTFFGGDIISSMVKHDRIDESNLELRKVGSAIAIARRELADVDVDLAADPLEVGSFLKTTDIWFDNLFSDLSVQGRLTDHLRTIERLHGRLAQLRVGVGAARLAAQQERDLLARRRQELLDPEPRTTH